MQLDTQPRFTLDLERQRLALLLRLFKLSTREERQPTIDTNDLAVDKLCAGAR
jgi:hypothetical protein